MTTRKNVQKTPGELLDALAGRSAAEVRTTIEGMSAAGMPNEACGFIVREKKKRGRVLVHQSDNRAADPQEFARIEDFDRVERKHEILAVWHSHPNRAPIPSGADKTMAESANLPLFIVCIPTREWGCYYPTGWRAPLLGREFAHGTHDCWSVIRDALRWPDMRTWAGADKTAVVEVPDFEREDNWWLPLKRLPDGREIRTRDPGEEIGPPLNIYLDNAKRAGFVRVEDLKTWDVLLIQMRSAVPNHAALYVGDGYILHHLEGRLSGLHPYLVDRGAYARHTYGIFRHKSLL